MVKITEKKFAQDLEINQTPMLVILDPDGGKLFSGGFTSVNDVGDGMKKALEKYAPKAIEWKDESAIKDANSFVLMAFTNDKKESETLLKNLEDRYPALVHDKFIFVKTAFDKDSPVAKKYGVMSSPLLLFIDPHQEGEKQVVGRISGGSPAVLKNFMSTNIAKSEKAADSK